MKTKCIVVSGFLESGKTTYINNLLLKKDNKRRLIICCEEGFVEYIKDSTTDIKKIEEWQLKETLFNTDVYDEIIVEYNGTWSVEPFLNLAIFKRVSLKWIHLIDGSTFDFYFANMYELMAPQIVNSDELIINRCNQKQEQEIYDKLAILNSNLKKVNYIYFLPILSVLCFIQNWPKFITIFASIIIQAVPFLLLGVVISTLVQFYLNDYKLAMFMQKNKFIGSILAITLSGFLPVCDCATVPIATRFAQKNIPISQVVIFLLASSSLNPLVILSTYFAFNDVKTVVLRISISILIAVIVGLRFATMKKQNFIKENLSMFSCTSGYLGVMSFSKFGKLELIFRHIGMEFIRLLKYVMFGSFVSTIIQMFIQKNELQIQNNLIVVLILLIIFVMFINICATSNAFVARALYTVFPYPFVILFMVAGPMLDFKNLLLLKNGFNKKFIFYYISSVILLIVVFYLLGVYFL